MMNRFLILESTPPHDVRIEGAAFEHLLSLCFARADAFSLSKYKYSYPGHLEQALRPYRIDSVQTGEWFGYFGCYPPMIEVIYQANEHTREILFRHYSSVFLDERFEDTTPKPRNARPSENVPSRLEDLCFFQAHRMFFGTVSHERICAANAEEGAFARELQKLARWRTAVRDCFQMTRRYPV